MRDVLITSGKYPPVVSYLRIDTTTKILPARHSVVENRTIWTVGKADGKLAAVLVEESPQSLISGSHAPLLNVHVHSQDNVILVTRKASRLSLF